MFVSSLLVAPTMQLVFFAYLGRSLSVGSDRFYVVGNGVLATSIPCLFGCTMAIANERRYGTLGAVLLSPRSRGVLWASRALPYVVIGTLVMGVTTLAGDLIFGVGLGFGAGVRLLPVLLSGAISCSALGLTLGALGLRLRDVFLLANLTAALLLLVTGIQVPPGRLPTWMVRVSDVVPLTHAAEAARRIAGGGARGAWWPLLAELAVGAVWALVALVLLHHFEVGSRRHDSLDAL